MNGAFEQWDISQKITGEGTDFPQEIAESTMEGKMLVIKERGFQLQWEGVYEGP